MSYEAGAIKWMVGMLFNRVGYVSLYIFGDGIWNTITHLRAALNLLLYLDQPDVLIPALLEIYIPAPEAFIESLFLYPAVGAVVGGLLWYEAVTSANR